MRLFPHMRTSSRNRAIVWGIIAFAALANIAGYLWDFYEQFWWFDDVLHAYTTFSITLPLALLLYGDVLRGAHARSILLILVITSLGMGIGVLWEVAEWAYDQMVPENAILGKRDTIIDLILDALGAVAAGIVTVNIVDS